MKITKSDTIVQVAKMYYLYDLNQNSIAEKLNISRSYVSKLLTEAKAQGIVKIEIVEPVRIETQDEKKLRKYFGIDSVVIVPKSIEKVNTVQVGDVAGKYIGSLIKSGDTIGFSWGQTMYHTVAGMPERSDLEDLKTIQLCGGISNVKKNIFVEEISHMMTKKYGSVGYILPFPAVVGNKQLKNDILKEQSARNIIDRVKDADILVMTVGSWGKQSSVARAGYLSEKEVEQLTRKGAVGDLFTHVIDINGNIVDKNLDDRTVAVSLDKLKDAEHRILIAVGVSKAEGIIAAIRTGVPNELITNEETVEVIRSSHPEIFNEE